MFSVLRSSLALVGVLGFAYAAPVAAETKINAIFMAQAAYSEAAFALNWTYMYNQANDPKESKIAGKVGVAPAPGVEGVSKASAVNGSMGLGVTATSKHPDEAWKYVVHMTSQPVQNAYAKLSLPVWASSYDDPSVTKGQEELIAAAKVSLPLMFPRPTTPRYQELSNALQVAIQQAILGTQTPEKALKSAADQSGL